MDTTTILANIVNLLNYLKDLPVYVWVIVGIIVLFTCGDKKLWEYEVKFPLSHGIGRGEIEINCLNRRGAEVSASFTLEPNYQNQDIQIFINNNLVSTISANQNSKSRTFIRQKYTSPRPDEGQEVTVKIRDELVFSGVLVLD